MRLVFESGLGWPITGLTLSSCCPYLSWFKKAGEGAVTLLLSISAFLFSLTHAIKWAALNFGTWHIQGGFYLVNGLDLVSHCYVT